MHDEQQHDPMDAENGRAFQMLEAALQSGFQAKPLEQRLKDNYAPNEVSC